MSSCFRGEYRCFSYSFNERTKDMVFALERKKIGKKIKQVPVIRYMNKTE